MGRSAQLPGSDRLLPDQATLALDLPVGHLGHKLLELFIGEVRANPPQAPSYVFAHRFLTKRVDLLHGGVAEGVLF